MRQFITTMLNIQEDKIEELQTIAQSDGSIIINLKLKVTSKICPFCSGPVKIHGYYPRTLTHSTLVNHKCSIVYRQRRFICPQLRTRSTHTHVTAQPTNLDQCL